MKILNTHLIRVVLCIAFAALVSGCKTVKGLGRDMQHLGGKIEEKADQETRY